MCAAAFAAAALAGCLVASRDGSAPLAIDHGAHVERGVGCTDCHEGATKEARAGMPKPDTCAACHDPKTDKPAIAGQVETFDAMLSSPTRTAAWPSPAVAGPGYADVRFSHAQHAAAKVECASCHPGAASGPRPNPGGPMRMAACVDCHRESGAYAAKGPGKPAAPPTATAVALALAAPLVTVPAPRRDECATCHERIGKDAPPPSHGPTWTLQHGVVSRMSDRGTTSERCELCHTRASCDWCHAQQKPPDHTEPFRETTHGFNAAMDRSRCMACHREDSCDRCHQEIQPLTHVPGFGAPQDLHCVSCHLPVSMTGCVVCHKGTPSHGRAPPKAPGVSAHRPGTPPSTCLSCHRQISHPVTMDDCNQCHR
jgi:hypothetical protein